jgi:outer membrane lipoprotein-sorting protein
MFILFFISTYAFAADVEGILDRVDRLYRSDTTFSSIEMNIKTPNWERTLKMDVWTRGLEYTFVVIESPPKDKGIATLKRKNSMWNYFPKINKVIKIPPSMMMSSWMGSDFTNDDLVKENTLRDDYKAKLTLEDESKYYISLTPKKQTISIWGKIELIVDKNMLYPLKQIYYDENGEKIRTMVFTEVKKVSGKTIPMKMTLTPHTKEKEGHETVITYLDIKFDPEISESVFSRRNLQKRR